MLTAYFSSKDYNGEDVINSLPSHFSIKKIDEWEETVLVKREKSYTKKINHCILFLEKNAVTPLRYYIKLELHKNVYPKEFQDDNVLFVRFTPDEKKETDRVIEKFCKAVEMTPPFFIPKNGFSFYIFKKSEEETSSSTSYIPQLLGLLRSYPSLSNATFNYGKKKKV